MSQVLSSMKMWRSRPEEAASDTNVSAGRIRLFPDSGADLFRPALTTGTDTDPYHNYSEKQAREKSFLSLTCFLIL